MARIESKNKSNRHLDYTISNYQRDFYSNMTTLIKKVGLRNIDKRKTEISSCKFCRVEKLWDHFRKQFSKISKMGQIWVFFCSKKAKSVCSCLRSRIARFILIKNKFSEGILLCWSGCLRMAGVILDIHMQPEMLFNYERERLDQIWKVWYEIQLLQDARPSGILAVRFPSYVN